MGGMMGAMGTAMGGMGMGMGGGMGMGAMPGGVVNLVKGGNMSLSKAVPNLHRVTIGLGWDVRQTPGAPFDLDASVFMLKGDGRVRMPQDLIFYNNRQSIDGSVFHHGDNLTGAGEGDDEQVSVDLNRVPPEIMKIVVVCSIYEAEARMQNFGMVSRAFIRVVNADNSMEIVRFDLTEEASMFNCMVFGELYRYNNEWKFRAIGQGVQGGLKACGPMFGIAMQ
jgi:tellurium resistance protein TerD